MVSQQIFWMIMCAVFYTDYTVTSDLLGLKFFVRSRPIPANFKPTPHPQEFEKFCPHRPAPQALPTRPQFFPPKTAPVTDEEEVYCYGARDRKVIESRPQ